MDSEDSGVDARWAAYVEAGRQNYLRLKQAGAEVTSNELAEARDRYVEALEGLSDHLRRARRPPRPPR